ncbi:Dabb family protein [Rhodococcus sp. D2-41]|uniref:Dabb family protein n=1 Tax=Speluncibacter jeojiensis TaxID=2710754 RepID=A0A9X4LYW7_9ACTN|nr:Dabb family protein [Rhodococcus sp. D2-41]MDG3010827.1 Dabb family protein [Rhodococcus sp. D2-41]MDG3013799.1 Dabb family protein [Corynebacteriales bacterium D3-21]
MIRHIVLFTLHEGVSWHDPRAVHAVEIAGRVGNEVPELLSWYAGKNISDRAVACDFVVVGLLRDPHDLERYLDNPFHQQAIRIWREISDWVIADVVEEDAVTLTRTNPREHEETNTREGANT